MSGLFNNTFNVSEPELEDFAAMKLKSATSNISKKDYYDLFELLNVYTFVELIGFHSKNYPNYDLAGTLKSLSDFKTVELEDKESEILGLESWDIVKNRMSTEIKNYIRMLQQERINAEKKG